MGFVAANAFAFGQLPVELTPGGKLSSKPAFTLLKTITERSAFG